MVLCKYEGQQINARIFRHEVDSELLFEVQVREVGGKHWRTRSTFNDYKDAREMFLSLVKQDSSWRNTKPVKRPQQDDADAPNYEAR